MKKKYGGVKHDGTTFNTDEAKKHGSNPEVSGNVVVHNVEEADKTKFEAHVKDFDKKKIRADHKSKNKPFNF
jgi:hypothetical protein